MSVHLVDIATRVLLADPSASLGDVAKAAGIGRTTLHKRYPTRQDLVVALADSALDVVDEAVADVDLTRPTREVLDDLVAKLVPLGPRLEFLLRFPGLEQDPRVAERLDRMDQPFLAFVATGQQQGQLRADLPAWWVLHTFYGVIFTAWEAIAAGRLAPLDAPRLVLTTFLEGVRP
ncbi:TetR/AcrR family transcriptional regulator [Saccharothrix sp.]|uniref:TetR/AcrR family transcriptional regulator n=1 Tax=Saccharothrix sp. TaxID=1873460 RepID=UPI0028128662|nr:TetR/AcrR family transcriptional regulator [Saccharothrix sp.]